MKRTFTLVIVVLSCFALAGTLCSVKPQFIVKTAPAGVPMPGNTITYQVTLNQAATGTQAVAISSSTPAKFSSMPSTIYVADGETTQSFQATLASTASGTVSVQATCNGHSASYDVGVENY